MSQSNCESISSLPRSSISTATSFLLHLEHSIKAFEGDFACLPANTRTDLTLTLLEAARFPNVGWKRFAIGQSELLARDLCDAYLDRGVARSRRLLSRIDRTTTQATIVLYTTEHDTQTRSVDKRMHSVVGQDIIQRSLDYI